MKKNMGTIDRVIRIIAAIVIVYLMATGALTGTLGTIFGIVAILFLLTGAIGICPGYIPFKISSLGKPQEPK